MPVCVAAGGLVVALATNAFTLAWTHSIEKIRWEEDYRVENGRLRLVEARIAGSGAGMEPPLHAAAQRADRRLRPSLTVGPGPRVRRGTPAMVAARRAAAQ